MQFPFFPPVLSRFPRLLLLALAGTAALLAFAPFPPAAPGGPASPSTTDTASARRVAERPVQRIPLGGPLAKANAEVSGMAWHGDALVLLPQHPFRMSGSADHGLLFTLTRQEIEAFLSGQHTGPLTPRPLTLLAPTLKMRTPSYQGFEALSFRGDSAFATVESVADAATGAMRGFLFGGRLSGDTLRLGTRRPVLLPPQTTAGNMAYEALLTPAGRVVALYEANGRNVNPHPRALAFDESLQPVDTLSFPTLEYRLTDATSLDADGRFWVMNYFFPGERAKLRPAPPAPSGPQTSAASSPRVTGATHRLSEAVERFVEFQLVENRIRRTPTTPLLLSLLDDTPRNWEGAVRFGSAARGAGFLLVTDQYPSTILGFVSIAASSGK